MTIIDRKTMSNQTETIYGLGLSGWQIASTWLNVCFIISSAATVVVLVGLWRSSVIIDRLREQANERYRIDVGVDIARADASAEAAKESSVKLQLALEQEKFKVAQIEASMSWRRISAASAAELIASLRKSPSKVHLTYIFEDPETIYYLIQFRRIFEAAGWSVTVSGGTSRGASFGLRVPDLPGISETIETVRMALSNAGIEFGTSLPVPDVSKEGQHQTPDEVLVAVELRPNLLMLPDIQQ